LMDNFVDVDSQKTFLLCSFPHSAGGSVMKKILFATLVLVSLMVCVASPAWASGLENAIAGFAAEKRGNYDEAIRFYSKAIKSGELPPETLSNVYFFRGRSWYQKGDYTKASADLTTAIESGKLSQGNLSLAYYSRGCAWVNKGNYDEAIADNTKAIEIDPRITGAYINRGNVWSYKGNDDKAIADYTKAIEINPKIARAYYNRGIAWYSKGDYDKAIGDYTKAIEINPKFADAYYGRGLAWKNKGNCGKAIADYSKAIETDPNYADAYKGLAWVMATCPEDRYRDGTRAVELAEKAWKMKKTFASLDTLAAAYAEAGRFQEAIKTQEKAITKLEQEGWTQYLSEYEERLSSYKAGKPWREK